LQLIGRVPPIHLAIPLLIPHGSRLLELEEVRAVAGSFAPNTLAYPWAHPDPRVDALHEEITAIVGTERSGDRIEVFNAISSLAHERARLPHSAMTAVAARIRTPYLDEPWYCCAEPTPEQLRRV